MTDLPLISLINLPWIPLLWELMDSLMPDPLSITLSIVSTQRAVKSLDPLMGTLLNLILARSNPNMLIRFQFDQPQSQDLLLLQRDLELDQLETKDQESNLALRSALMVRSTNLV